MMRDGYQVMTVHWRARLWCWLGFGRAYVFELDDDWPEEICTDLVIRLSIGDRVRALLSGRISVHVRCGIEHPAERIETKAATSVLPIGWKS